MTYQTKLILAGYGKMGAEIEKLILGDSRFVLGAIVDQNHQSSEIEVYDSMEKVPPEAGSIVIDFSGPELAVSAQAWCLKNRKPLVSGTTGLSPDQFDGFMRLAREVPVVWAPNMSLGIAFIETLLEKFGSLKEFDFQIEETHHNKKKDRPSGTAVFLQERLEKALGKKLPETLSIRGGGVFGVHKIIAMGQEETIALEHTALNRAVFARGALSAAFWLLRKKKGFYSLRDFVAEKL